MKPVKFLLVPPAVLLHHTLLRPPIAYSRNYADVRARHNAFQFAEVRVHRGQVLGRHAEPRSEHRGRLVPVGSEQRPEVELVILSKQVGGWHKGIRAPKLEPVGAVVERDAVQRVANLSAHLALPHHHPCARGERVGPDRFVRHMQAERKRMPLHPPLRRP
eukprot:2178934-Rhodomonas_salina.1